MIQDLTISYVCNVIETTLTIKDEHYDNITLSDEEYEMYIKYAINKLHCNYYENN